MNSRRNLNLKTFAPRNESFQANYFGPVSPFDIIATILALFIDFELVFKKCLVNFCLFVGKSIVWQILQIDSKSTDSGI